LLLIVSPVKLIHQTNSIPLPEHTQGAFPKQGTTSFLATVVFPKEYPEKISAVLSRLNEAVGKQGNGAIMEGIHAEVRGQAQIVNSGYVV
jgi:N-acetylglucosamine-6-phosphate deacetylase